ncbi:hypothetical protein MKX07_001340 [Trichoderma sp. CBMAI-0711]|uniref:Zn2Cys6 transcriptional regulator n=1 Tax=Trichoderma parareesei TaxID=858221 RepID=A0A2H2ZMZ1_TRIPA|nr:hypothetical protein MKX07_001340 [Trichoderma sp. CBMAI-0711]OTA08143.1 Zn2Cys6 transcriptional regulator [Trichoderma parareesei]
MTQISAFGELRPRKASDLNQEIEALANYVGRFEFVPNTSVILVCRHGAIEGLTDKIHNKRQEKALSRFKNLSIKVTDDIRLFAVISAVEKTESYDNLIIIVSGFIDHLYFNVGSNITDLRVYRCGTELNHEGYLYVDGFSIFHGQPILRWEAMHHEARLWLGPGVVLNLGSHIGQLGRLSDDSSSMSDFDQEKIRANIEKMENLEMEGSWWDAFKAPISAIVSILAKAAKLSHAGYIKMTSSGMFVQYKFVGFALFSAAAAVAVDTVSAGTALLVAPGVAASIYFIPWESVFGWLNRVISWLKTGIKKIWDKIKDWLATCASTVRDALGLDGRSHGPVKFSA